MHLSLIQRQSTPRGSRCGRAAGAPVPERARAPSRVVVWQLVPQLISRSLIRLERRGPSCLRRSRGRQAKVFRIFSTTARGGRNASTVMPPPQFSHVRTSHLNTRDSSSAHGTRDGASADVHAAVRYLHSHAAELGAAPARVALAGDGAGAALAYPLADARLTSASWERLGGRGYLIAPADVRATLALYLDQAQLTDPRVSPLLFADRDLRPLPRTLLLVAELDPALDDGEALAARLRAAAGNGLLRPPPALVPASCSWPVWSRPRCAPWTAWANFSAPLSRSRDEPAPIRTGQVSLLKDVSRESMLRERARKVCSSAVSALCGPSEQQVRIVCSRRSNERSKLSSLAGALPSILSAMPSSALASSASNSRWASSTASGKPKPARRKRYFSNATCIRKSAPRSGCPWRIRSPTTSPAS